MTGTEGGVTWGELLAETTVRLGDPVAARWIVEEVSGLVGVDVMGVGRSDRSEVRGSAGAGAQGEGAGRPATIREVARLDALVERRLAGEPVQYVLGRWGFRRLDLMVDRRVLIPRPETEQVVGAALAELGLRPGPHRVVDLGTGSGAIALSVAVEMPGAQVWATDRSEDALEVARANLAGLGRAAAGVRLLAGDWFGALPEDLRGRVSLVVSNPPYVPDAAPLPPDVAGWEPVGALRAGPDGLDAIRLVVAGAPEWLESGGALIVECGDEQAPGVVELARGWAAAVEVGHDLTGRSRWVVARTR